MKNSLPVRNTTSSSKMKQLNQLINDNNVLYILIDYNILKINTSNNYNPPKKKN